MARGTPPPALTPDDVDRFLEHLEGDSRMQSTTSSGVDAIRHTLMQHRQLSAPGMRAETGDHFGTLKVVLTGKLDGPPNEAIIDAWRQKIQLPAGMEKFSIRQARGGLHQSQSRSSFDRWGG